jgi:hypothetical protein
MDLVLMSLILGRTGLMTCLRFALLCFASLVDGFTRLLFPYSNL